MACHRYVRWYLVAPLHSAFQKDGYSACQTAFTAFLQGSVSMVTGFGHDTYPKTTQRTRSHHRLSLRYRPPHAKALSSSIHLQPQTAHRASTNNLKSISIYISSRCSMHGSEESQNIEKDLFEVASTAHDFISCSTDVLLQCNVAGLVQSCYVYTGGDL